ncbi:RNA polymerase sigma factor [Planctomycetes bacterium Pan216]|uniref:RNA polymerase sigma factor n=1 Tax=Kolteria novifilia TaxID=2527975 RepID=A0A518B9P1_9BACT|nr:RNA polymerase sigma factor [Planctomycetes bacterium Pan216]
MQQTSSSLLGQLKAAPDDDAWRRFVQRYSPIIHDWLRRQGLQDHDLRDVGQDVLMTVVREMPGFTYDRRRGHFRGWLRQVVVNRLRMFWRQRKHRARGQADGYTEDFVDQLADPNSDAARQWNEVYDRQISAQVLETLRGEFEPTTWQAFWRVVVDSEKAATVSAELGISLNAVYLAKSRVLKRLRQERERVVGL